MCVPLMCSTAAETDFFLRLDVYKQTQTHALPSSYKLQLLTVCAGRRSLIAITLAMLLWFFVVWAFAES